MYFSFSHSLMPSIPPISTYRTARLCNSYNPSSLPSLSLSMPSWASMKNFPLPSTSKANVNKEMGIFIQSSERTIESKFWGKKFWLETYSNSKKTIKFLQTVFSYKETISSCFRNILLMLLNARRILWRCVSQKSRTILNHYTSPISNSIWMK